MGRNAGITALGTFMMLITKTAARTSTTPDLGGFVF